MSNAGGQNRQPVHLSDGIVTLRSPVDADAPVYARLVRDSIEHLQPWMVWARPGYTPDDALGWIQNVIDPTAHPLVIVAPDGAIAGSAGLNDVRMANGVANLGYWLSPAYTGAGLATRATDLTLRWAIEELGLARIEILMSVDNEPSRLVAQRSLARYEGIRRGYLRYDGRNHDTHSFALIASDLDEDPGDGATDGYL